MRRHSYLVLLVALACSAPEPRQAFMRDLDAFMKEHLTDDQPGGSVLVMKDTTVVFSRAYGLADLNTREKLTPKTLFNLGSISKTFVANGILILQAQGKLSVEDSLAKYFPDFKNKALAQKIKIKHLLTH